MDCRAELDVLLAVPSAQSACGMENNMKFTEGYWLLSERTNGQFASQAYHIEAMEN